MALFVDVHHHVEGLTAQAVAGAHERDLEVQKKYGVTYLKYWFDEGTGQVFCLVEARTKRLLKRCTVRRTAWLRMRLLKSWKVHRETCWPLDSGARRGQHV